MNEKETTNLDLKKKNPQMLFSSDDSDNPSPSKKEIVRIRLRK